MTDARQRTVWQDDRERLPLEFAGWAVEVRRLAVGDYTLPDLAGRAAVERKGLVELGYACRPRSPGMRRLDGQLRRLAALAHAAVVVEGTIRMIRLGHCGAAVEPRQVLAQIDAWMAAYPGVQWLLVDSRREAAERTAGWLTSVERRISTTQVRASHGRNG